MTSTNQRVAVRDLEQIQEDDDPTRMPRAATLAFVGLGATCLVFAAMALGGRTTTAPVTRTDPLGALMMQQGGKPAASAAASQLSSREVTFPGLLSDNAAPTTALAAVVGGGPRGQAGQTGQAGQAGQTGQFGQTAQPGQTMAASAMTAPAPAPLDRIPVMPLPGRGQPAPMAADMAAAQIPPAPAAAPVVAAAPAPPPTTPLPAQNVLEATPIVTRPRDNVTREATAAAQLAQSGSPQSGPGHDGGYQLQVSSFHTQDEANGFAEQLRARNHKAYVVEAQVPGRGTWFRVRIGPFKDQHSAAAYRASFETREHVVPFIVPPNAK